MCLQQNTQNTCDVHRRARLETRKNFNDKYFVKLKLKLGTVQCSTVTSAIMVLGKELVGAR